MQGSGIIEIDIGILKPELELRVPASEDSLPVVRQALRSLGETVAAEREALEDAELAVTEACANAVEHAYGDDDGMMLITFRPDDADMLVSVRDYGTGMPAEGRRRREDRGFGLAMIEGIAREMEIRGDDGTEISMALAMGVPEVETVDGAAPGVAPAERILRRLVAVLAAQADMPTERVMEALLVAEMAARHGLRRLVGDRIRVRFTRDGDAFEVRVGPLEEHGARAVVDDSEVAVIGSVVGLLADEVRIERESEGQVDCEYLTLRIEPRG